MEDWARRIKDLADARGWNDSDIAKAAGIKAPNSVTQWWGTVKGKRPTSEIRVAPLMNLSQALDVPAEYIMTGRRSQSVSIDPETIAHAFVAVERALRKRGIKYDAAQVPEILAFAYKERLALPPGRDPVILGTFDRTVERELARIMAYERQPDRPPPAPGGGENAQAPSAAPKARRGEKRGG